jgi:acetate kinase
MMQNKVKKIAVINSGSSSIKFKLFDMQKHEVIASELIESNSKELVEQLFKKYDGFDMVGHRVVHGGEEFSESVLIDEHVMQKIESLIPLAPLHNPANLYGIKVVKELYPNVPQVAVFDTAFHSSMPKEAYMYALPYGLYEDKKLRKYGFHGTSHSFVMKQTAKILSKDVDELNIITLHLGNGASACAIENGKSIDTSMGFTPLEGLVMGSRSGDIDPAIVIYLQREIGMSFDEVDKLLNKKSGLLGICGDNDVRAIVESDDEKSKLAIDMMVRRIKKYIGSYMALLRRVDAIVFTGGIGENSAYIRDRVVDGLRLLDTKVLVVKTDEELEIARECLKVSAFL